MNIQNLNLVDFSFEQLNWLYLVLDEKRRDFEYKIEAASKMDPSVLKYELFDFFNEQFNICIQFQTKVDEAAKFVKTREIMSSSN